jgi:DNA-binding XRE family transcriptional regulator/tetratricopeptide (TPR) repeat protein
MTQQPYSDPLGSLVKHIREHELQLSQVDFAWLAGVSRGTISNLETGRVTPDARTWHSIRTALALPPISLEQARDGIVAQPVISADAVQGIIYGILTIRDHDSELGRRAADRWRRVVTRLTRDDAQAWPAANVELTWLAGDVATLAPTDKVPIIHDALRRWGWASAPAPPSAGALASPGPQGLQQVQALVSTVNDVAEQLRVYQDHAQGFERLPSRLQDILSHGLVVSSTITSPESSPEVSIASLIVMNETDSSLAAQHEAYEAAKRWSEILAVATHIVERQAPHLTPDEIIQALKVGLDARSPVEVSELLPVARRGDPRAMYKLARLFKKNGRPDEAERWFRRAAEAGHPGALFNLGNLAYEDGRHREAEHWLTEAAEAGHPNAMYVLSALLRNSDPQLAERWLRSAADAGNRDAMYQLWILHREGGEQEVAEQWLRRAANYGHRQALTRVSTLTNPPPVDAGRWPGHLGRGTP